MIKLFTDTSANLPVELSLKNDIKTVPFAYTVNGVSADYSDTADFNGKKFYDAMREGADVKTSMVNIDVFTSAFEEELKQGNDVLYVGMSGGISGTAHAAALAAEELKEKYPSRSVLTVDTYAASLGEGLMVLDAAKMIREGKDIADIAETLTENRAHMCQYFTVDDLKYLKKGGRINGIEAFIGTILRIKPVLTGDESGHIVAYCKVRGRRQALKTLAQKYSELASDKSADIGIAHADAEEGAYDLVEMLREYGFTGNCLTVCYEPVTGSHVGPGAVALFFRGSHK